jgi:hypothetical protein
MSQWDHSLFFWGETIAFWWNGSNSWPLKLALRPRDRVQGQSRIGPFLSIQPLIQAPTISNSFTCQQMEMAGWARNSGVWALAQPGQRVQCSKVAGHMTSTFCTFSWSSSSHPYLATCYLGEKPKCRGLYLFMGCIRRHVLYSNHKQWW